MTDPDDPAEGTGDPAAYDGLAVAHLTTEAGQAEVDEDMPEPEHDEVEA